MAALAVAFEPWIKVLVVRTVRIGAVGPFRISALDGEATCPSAQLILDWQSIGHIVAGRAHLSAHEHCLVVSLVLGWIYFLIRNVLAENLAGVRITR